MSVRTQHTAEWGGSGVARGGTRPVARDEAGEGVQLPAEALACPAGVGGVGGT